ncbi:SpoIIE family protein phosphatase [Fundidesulfovibrio agrisoli]|uniref:SpoIIE family protein phosphatase n=1 Tax=Fundidesulfovibrio agrisoli TaxID=2922717 RepID=UPI001FAC149B|nr:SpoIIE family protein phosphatase [Fundidesulfovibrio agrisoli]
MIHSTRRFSLKAKFNLAVALVYLLAAAGSLVAFAFVTHSILGEFAQRIAVKQALLERNKVMTIIDREEALARTLAGDPLVRRWAADEADPALRQAALEQLENYRRQFRDRSVFLALKSSARYYIAERDQKGEVQTRILRRDHPADAWFFETLSKVDSFALNLDHNPSFNVTKVWFNVVVRGAGGEKIGVGGGGIDLGDFLREAVGASDEAVSIAIVDRAGVLQAWGDPDVVKRNAMERDDSKKTTLYSMLRNSQDQQRMRQALQALDGSPQGVESFPVHLEGGETLAAVTALPGIGWYTVALVNVSGVVSSRVFMPVLALLVLSLLAVIVMVGWLLGRIVIGPLARLNRASLEVAQGRYDVTLPVDRNDEIGQLTQSFNAMTAKVLDYTQNLEQMVLGRTAELSEANDHLRESRQRIMESLRYARTIQQSILPRPALMDRAFASHMSLYLPRDIVGGDLIYLRRFEGLSVAALMDCTGHGVPGAFMTMTAHSVLNHVLDTLDSRDPARILSRFDGVLRETLGLHETGEGSLDCGLDMALCVIHRDGTGGGRVLFAGAGLPLYRLRGGVLTEIKGDRRRLGYRGEFKEYAYTTHEFSDCAGDVYYAVTDGFLDEGGGDKGYCFGPERFREMILAHAGAPLKRQAEAFEHALALYRGARKQRDDIAMLGFSI